MDRTDADPRLAEQMAYYRALAPEYDGWSRQDPAELERPELARLLAEFDPAGDVLELAGGTGEWTVELAPFARRLTVLDASPETVAINRAKLAPLPVEYVVADLFDWRPPRQFDVVFFSYWLSHVPVDRFDDFWRLVATCLAPDGRVFCVDNARPAQDPSGTMVDDPGRGVSRRRLVDGVRYTVVKVYWTPKTLTQRLATLGFDVQATCTRSGHCLVASGVRRGR